MDEIETAYGQQMNGHNSMRLKRTHKTRRAGLRRALLAALVAPAVLVSTACSKVVVDFTETLPPALFGGWVWVEATGGIAGVTLTPETEGFTRGLVIVSPNQITLVQAEQIVLETTAEFIAENETDPALLRYAQPLLGSSQQSVEFNEQGDLVLTDPCCDGFAYVWRRL